MLTYFFYFFNRPPYFGIAAARTATHCFIDQKSSVSKFEEQDLKELQKAGTKIVTLSYLNAFLVEDHVDLSKYSVKFT